MRKSLIVVVVLFTVVSANVGLAENADWPPAESVTDLSKSTTWPDDNSYHDMWELFSFIPDDAKTLVRQEELSMGSGIHADRAWQKTTGDDRVVIAVLDSGIRWSELDLVNKYYLNRGELPEPDVACRTAAFDASRPYDANGDGMFNIQDYTTEMGAGVPKTPCDPRIINYAGTWDTNGNTFLDPQDLIQIFSDGKDDDANGYIDDISGWDFFDNDNDANDDTNYGHGTGEAKDSAAQGNNGVGRIGVCPKCRVLMVRVGDSFMATANDFALGTVFAVDSGASVVQEALGGLGNNPFARQAIDYAYNSNVVIIGSAADENSFHANLPGANDHVVYCHAITHDGLRVNTSTTFLNFNNCTNYGPRLELSTPGNSCSSEAVGKTAGVAGLLYSAALKADLDFPSGKASATDTFGARRLSAEEVRQILITTVDDINIPDAKDDPTKYPSRAGWEQRFGYGRTNVRSAVDVILASKIPPEVDLQSPEWFDILYPDRTPNVAITGRISFRKAFFESVDYVIEWAPGADPENSAFTTLVKKEGVTDPIDGTLYDWDISQLSVDNADMPAPDYDTNRRMITVRIRVTANSTKLGAVKGETRKAFHVERDESLLSNFPIQLGAGGDSSPKLADLDGDGKREIIVATADGQVHAIDGLGRPLPGWPVKIEKIQALDSDIAGNVRLSYAYDKGGIDADKHAMVMAAVAIGDLDGDKSLEVVVASYEGKVHVFGSDGTLRPGFPVSVDNLDLNTLTDGDNIIDDGVFAAPALADLDGDGKLEIVVAALDGKIYVWRENGEGQTGFPVLLQDPRGQGSDASLMRARIVSSPAIGDVDGDGDLDIVVGSNELLDGFGTVYVVHGRGNEHGSGAAYHDGWPQRIVSFEVLPMVGEGIPISPALADVNRDGIVEIAIGGVGTKALIRRNTGEEMIPLCLARDNVDFSKDGWQKEVIPCTRKITKSCAEEEAADSRVFCVGGAMKNNVFGDKSNCSDNPSVVLVSNPSFGDLNNDQWPDLLFPMGGFGAAETFASGGTRSDFEHHLGAWNTVSGEYLPGFPQRTNDWQFFMNISVADIDGDDLPEILAGSGGYWQRAFNVNGKEPAGWPKLAGQWIIGSPAVGDITGDGKLEVVSITRWGWLYAWQTEGKTTGRIDWESFGHDNHNSRNFENKLEQGIRASELPATPDGGVQDDAGYGTDCANGSDECEGNGCSCEVGGGASTPWMALLLVLFFIRRKKGPKRR
jgi:MYXO-CTERM domain-containing protein